jgi:hypothetical protein
MEKFHCIFPSPALLQSFVGLFDHSPLQAWVAWLPWFHVFDSKGLLLQSL